MAEEVEHQSGEGKPLPAEFTALKPMILIPGGKADKAVQLYKAAFGAEELKRTTKRSSNSADEIISFLCAEIKIGSASLLVCDQTDDSSSALGIVIRVETEDVAGALARAVDAGMVPVGEIVEEEGACCGGVIGKVKDPFGLLWIIAGKRTGDLCC